MSSFCHLHGHTQFSLRDAISRPQQLIRRVSELGQTSVGITDHGNMSAVPEYLKSAKDHNIKLITGCEFYVAANGVDDHTKRNSFHLTVLALDKEGYHNLCRLHSISYEKKWYDPLIDFDLLDKYSSGLIALSGCLGGCIPKALLGEGGLPEAERRIVQLKQILPGRFWIELQNHTIEEQISIEPTLRSLAKKHKLPLCPTNDFHYVEESDWIAHDLIVCGRTGSLLGASNRIIEYVPKEFHVKSADEMALRFSPGELKQSQRIADMADRIDLSSKSFHIPQFNKKPDATLRELVAAGIKSRYGKPTPSPEVMARVSYELDTICKAGFASYFLIVHDLYQWMTSEEIPFGPGRGSVVGSIVAYALGLTELDPIAFDLLFERFLNPARVSMPDVDMDISQTQRDRVIDYLKGKWGTECVAQIVTFQTLGARAAIRDIGRVMGYEYTFCALLADMIPLEGSITRDRESRHYIADAIESQAPLAKRYKEDEKATKLLNAAMSVEGLPKSESTHASGVVIADKDLAEYLPMIKVKNSKKQDIVVTGYGMNDLEDLGLIKFDILGLKTVDVLDQALRSIQEAGSLPKSFDKTRIPYDDAKTLKMLAAGLTQGVFQLESPGMSGWLRKLKPDRIDDVMAMVALYRPGPMEHIGSFVNRKIGREKVTYPHPSLKAVLQETYGIPIYQEQLMRIGQIIAGWSLSRADQLRKIIGKKIVDDVAQERMEFIADGQKQGHKAVWLANLFDDFIAPAAKYSFNKAHSAAYGLLAYQTAYLKANYPVYYFKALLTSVQDKMEKMVAYINDAKSMGIAVLPPDINESELSFTVIDNKTLRFGLGGIKHVGTAAMDLAIKERKRGAFVDLFDFISRTRNRLITSRTIECLVSSGTLDNLPGTRAEKLATIEPACDRCDMLAEDAKRVADGGVAVRRKKPIPSADLVDSESDTDAELTAERELLGFYLSGHPFTKFTDRARDVASVAIGDMRELFSGQAATICGVVSHVEIRLTKKKQQMLSGVLEDDKARVKFIVFPTQFSICEPVLKVGSIVVLDGRVKCDSDDAAFSDSDSAQLDFQVDKARVLAGAAKAKVKVESVEAVDAHLSYENYEKELAFLIDQVEAGARFKIHLPNGQTFTTPIQRAQEFY